MKGITLFICLRPFEGEWKERNETVLRSLAWQGVPDLKVVLVHWPGEESTVAYAREHGLGTLEVPQVSHYLFTNPLPSFKGMFEAALHQCETELFVYMNGDIVLGPGILPWLQEHARPQTMYSLPRHNWNYSGPLHTPEDFNNAVIEPEPWTALDIFAFHTGEALEDLTPLPPFIMTAGSMDSWLVAKAGTVGWDRRLIPAADHTMLHIEHPASHPFKAGADEVKRLRWAFNCGIYAAEVQDMPADMLKDTSLACFDGAEEERVVKDVHATQSNQRIQQ